MAAITSILKIEGRWTVAPSQGSDSWPSTNGRLHSVPPMWSNSPFLMPETNASHSGKV
jgi:hypothetical protein